MVSIKNLASLNGRPFWSGVIDLRDGQIVETHTYETAAANDFHHSYYITPAGNELLLNGEGAFFWLDKAADGGVQVQSDSGFGRSQEYGKETVANIANWVANQVQFRGSESKMRVHHAPIPPSVRARLPGFRAGMSERVRTKEDILAELEAMKELEDSVK